ncbi:MAG: hypothetical protein ACLFSN_03240 [Candidatus Woesearchaeota archaeon]
MTFKTLLGKAKESNIVRFFAGLAIFFVAIALLVVLLWILFPVVVAGSLVIIVVLAVALGLIAVIGFFTAIWYLSRKEPELGDKKKKASKKYRFSQGRSK